MKPVSTTSGASRWVSCDDARQLPDASVRLVPALYYRLHAVVRELMKFGVVGGVAFVVDIATFNVARQALELGPLTAKTLSVALATTVAYAGNRVWTFRHRDRQGLAREYVLFVVLNGVGLLIALACLGVTYYVLGLRSVLAENVSANVVGLGLGTAFRFWAYRRWVFPELPSIASLGPGHRVSGEGTAGTPPATRRSARRPVPRPLPPPSRQRH